MTTAALSPLNLPVLLLTTLLLLAAAAYVLRSWENWVSIGTALVTGGLGFWLWKIDLSEPLRPLPFSSQVVDLTAPFTRWGLTLQLQAGAIPVVVASLLLVAAACALAAHVSQGETFIPFALVLTAGYVALALLVTGPLAPPLLTPLFLVVLSSLSVLVVQGRRLTAPGGPLRMLAPPVLAFPLFLAAFWYIDQIPLNPQDPSAQQSAAQLLSLGLLLLLGPVPLHSAQPATAQSAPSIIVALVTLLYQLALLHLFFRLLLAFPFVNEQDFLHEWLSWAGLATAVWGGIAAAGATHPGRLWGYAALHDWGLIILVLAVPGLPSGLLALFLFGLRAVSMFTAAAGLAVLEKHLGDLRTDRLRGVAARLPWNSAAFLLGGLGLAGFPLSAGFTGHWAALQLIAQNDWLPAVVVLLASAGAIFSFIRLARELFGPLQNRYLPRETLTGTVLAILVLLLSVSLALAPQWFDSPVTRALAALRS